MSIFKSTFVKEVREQLSIRQQAITTRDTQKLYQLNSRNAWIRATSSVNIDGTSDKAKEYVLQGGVLTGGKLSQGGIGGSYSHLNTRGIRPMPGITSVDVKSKSAYGSLREATISFSCNSIEQLEILELLYMRPGYTVLLEWGWLPYLDNNGKLQSNLTDLNTSVINGSFTTMSEVFDDLFQRSKRLNGNYDALFGKVSNYSWSARPDGGYDCQTTLISIGEVIESLKVNSVPYDVKSVATRGGLLSLKPSPDQKILETSYSLNKLSGLLTELETFAEAELEKIDTPRGTKAYAGAAEAEGVKYDLLSMRVAAIKEGTDIGDLKSSAVKSFITLESLTKLLNNYVLLAVSKDSGSSNSQPLASISVESNPKLYDSGSTNTSGPLLCIAHPYQVSVDIDTCIITNSVWAKGKVTVSGVTAQPSTNSSKISAVDPSVYNKYATSFNSVINVLVKEYNVKNEAAKASQRSRGEAETGLPNDTIFTQYFTPLGKGLYNIFAKQSELDKFENETIAGQSFAASLAKFANSTATNDIIKDFISQRSSYMFTPETDFPKLAAFRSSIDGITDSAVLAATAQTIRSAEIVVKPIGHLKLLETVTNDSLKIFQVPGKDELGVTGNIYVNINMLQRLVNSNNVGSEKREIQLYSFLKTVMSKIQESIGNVNNFDVHLDPADGNVGRIIDVNLTIPISERKNLADNAFEISLGTIGPTGSIVRSYNIQSQIFPNQSSLISIGAQSQDRGGEQGTQNYTLLSFNRGITDRNLPSKVDPKSAEKLPTADEIKENVLKPNLTVLNDYLFPQDAQVKIDKNNIEIIAETGKYKNALRDIIAYSLGVSKSPIRTSSIIPIQLSLTLDGIGGMIIGNIFKIPDTALPKGYKFEPGSTSKLAQTVVGLSHRLENNDWTTTIDAYNIILDNETPGTIVEPSEPPQPPAQGSTKGSNTVPSQLTPDGLRYPFDGNFPTPTGLFEKRAGEDGKFGTGDDYTHGGIDIAINAGTTLYAAEDGQVILASTNTKDAGGIQVQILYNKPGSRLNGLSTLYSHLSRLDVSYGAKVKKGDPVGASGNTGRSTGAHLHLEVRSGKSKLNPGDYFPAFKV